MPASPDASSIFIHVCAWCGITLSGDEIVSGSTAGTRLLTHGICSACRDALIREAAAQRMTAQEVQPPEEEAA